jgi:FMN reductase
MSSSPLIVGIGGTTRAGSTSEQALKTALAYASALGCETLLFPGPQLPSEIYDPTQLLRSESAAALVSALRRADGVIIATPAYHGGLSGLVKNALDFTEDLRSDARVYLEGRAVGCIVCAEGAQAMGSTLASLRAIVHALRGWPTPFGATLNSTNKPFGSADQAADATAIQACHTVAQQVVDFARMRLNRPNS